MKKNMKNLLKKFKKQTKLYKFSFLIIGILYILNLFIFTYLTKFFMTKYLLSLVLEVIDQYLKISNFNLIFNIIIVFLYLYILLYLLFGLINMFTKKKIKYILLMFFTLILSTIMFIGSYNIIKIYKTIDNTQKKYVTYSSVMISMNNINEYNTIGMINSKNDPTGYILPKEMIKKENIKGSIKKYDDYISMLNDMYDGKIDSMFVQKDYITMFSSYEKFANIGNETKVVYSYSKKMENVDNISYSTKDISEPFTILLMGVDGTGNGIAKNGSFNGDTLMLVSFNPKTLSATVFSIPRDTYVPIACNGNRENKINSSSYGGTSCVVNTIENLTKIKIDYYAKINFSGVVSLVDDLGGITVDVPMTFCEQDSQRRFGEFELCMNKGVQELNGEQALALSRHRHSLPLGDFQRVQNQQLVVEAMVQKLKTVRDVNAFYKILNDVSNNIDTNMSTNQILGFFNTFKDMLVNKLHNSNQISIQKTYLTGYDFTMNIPGMGNVYTFQYYKESLNDITKAMKITLGLVKPTLTKSFEFDASENYEPQVAGKQYYNEERKETLPNFVGKDISNLKSWAGFRNIAININEIKSGNSLFDDSKPDGYILTQSVAAGRDVSTINSITVSVIVKEQIIDTTTTKKDNQSINNNNIEKNETDDDKKNEESIIEESTSSENNVIESSSSSEENIKTEVENN